MNSTARLTGGSPVDVERDLFNQAISSPAFSLLDFTSSSSDSSLESSLESLLVAHYSGNISSNSK